MSAKRTQDRAAVRLARRIVSVPGADHLASVLSLHLQFADATFRSVVDARRAIYPALAYQAAENATRQDIATLQESIARMHACVHDLKLFREEIRVIRVHSVSWPVGAMK